MAARTYWHADTLGVQSRYVYSVCAGTSSFGMSGVNAHAIFLAATPGSEVNDAGTALTYHRQRYWAICKPFHLLGAMRAGKKHSSSFALDLCASELAFLGDHLVRLPFLSNKQPSTLVFNAKG